MKFLNRILITAAFILIIGLIAGGIWFYHSQGESLRNGIENNLASIAKLKVNQIAAWRSGILAEGIALEEDLLLAKHMSAFIAEANAEDGEQVLSSLRSIRKRGNYQNILLVDAKGQVLLNLLDTKDDVIQEVMSELVAALHGRKPVLTDLHVCDFDARPHINVITPFYDGNQQSGRALGAVIIVCEADKFLFPLVQSWPVASSTAETLLVRRDGDSVLFLNELRHQSDTALKLRIPLSRTDVPAVKAVLGVQGVNEGLDYRGIEVLSAIYPVPDSPWFMVAKEDADEIFGEWNFRSRMILVLLSVAVLLAFFAGLTIWQYNRKTYYRTLYKTEVNLRESEERFRLIFEQAAVGIALVGIDGRYLRVNQRMCDITGYSEDKLLQKTFRDIVHPADVDKELGFMNRALSGETRTYSMDKRILHRDGSTVWANVTAGLVRDLLNAPKNFVFVVEDISERKRFEEAISRANQDLLRSNQELEQFAYVASHDLQEPLRMVSSYTQLLSQRYKGKLDGDAEEFIGFAVDGANRMQRLIQDLLMYSRINTRGETFKPIDTHAALGEALFNLQAVIKESGAIVANGELPAVQADGTQVALLFQNLISNAVKFRKKDEPPRIRVSAEIRGDECVFSVSDNGIGIDNKYFDRIFVIFQRLHSRDKYPGTGIGLAICKRIVDRHNGRIWVESEPGKGSVFFFTLRKAR
ncbi:MAG: PAS domain S-box protein [Planctomycetes bacterium]|nr:PAS domain S-box protein [Planctomycetota bacterium]